MEVIIVGVITTLIFIFSLYKIMLEAFEFDTIQSLRDSGRYDEVAALYDAQAEQEEDPLTKASFYRLAAEEVIDASKAMSYIQKAINSLNLALAFASPMTSVEEVTAELLEAQEELERLATL
jgi:hypothetical protein